MKQFQAFLFITWIGWCTWHMLNVGLGISDFKPKGAFQSHFVFRQSWFYEFVLSCFFLLCFFIKQTHWAFSFFVSAPTFPIETFPVFVSTPTICIDASNATVQQRLETCSHISWKTPDVLHVATDQDFTATNNVT